SGSRRLGRWSMALAAGLVAAAAALLLGRPAHPPASLGPRVARSSGLPAPVVSTKPAASNSPHQPPPPVAVVRPDGGSDSGHRPTNEEQIARPARQDGPALPGRVAWQRPSPVAGQVDPGGRGNVIAAASEGNLDPDLVRLNGGRLSQGTPFSPLPSAAPLPAPPPLVERRAPGSLLLGDLLHLNPIRVAGVGDAGFSAAAQTLAAEAPASDARLQQRVFVHAGGLKLSDLLARLTKATGVTMLARLEIA